MAAGTIAALTSPIIDAEVVASATVGTTVYVITNRGKIYSYTISGEANAYLARVNEKPTAMATLGTNLYIGTGQGNIYKVVMSGGATTVLANVGGAIEALCMYGTAIYVSMAGGLFKSVSTS